ncbi:mesenchyme-specific cell surface glycoprotein-like [Ylistrum balloti]|uniref:mesenchyme-specific cell surface glycoprotein-like n=1 Tax=Ylistrum balloti TaxID=509963 RepID=UPI002905A8F5|nr:mesenchyme-specific cell surface glycoprotein-like [Ylistrum balloti]
MAVTSVTSVLVCVFSVTLANYYLKPLSYTKLPTKSTPTETFQLFGGTAEEGAYDPVKKMLYVVGETSRLLHILDVSDPVNPVRVFTHQFTTIEGRPRDIAICGDDMAVALTSDIRDVYEGHVQFFKTFTKGDSFLHYNGSRLPVGSFPDMLTYTPDCAAVLVANEGKPGRDITNTFQDPPGTVQIIRKPRTGSPSEQNVNFDKFNSRYDVRIPARYIPTSTWPLPNAVTVSQGLEPEYIAVTPDSRYAFITLQENNAIAKLSLSDGIMTDLWPLTPKEWRDIGIDSTDRDGGIHLRQYPWVSLQQPDAAKVFTIGRKTFLFTLDEGAPTTYTSSVHGFNWADHAKSDALIRAQKYDSSSINNSTFYEDLTKENMAGYLTVSNIDSLNLFSDKLGKVTHFGGRGFSIWDTQDMSLVWDSRDEIEKSMELLMYNVFNTDIVSSTITYTSPENLRDTTSDLQGAKLNGMDILVQKNGSDFLLVGSETVGALFLYTINSTSGKPVPRFESAHRAGRTDFVWKELYDMDEAGDAYISAIGLISAEDSPNNNVMAYVISDVSGSVSLYSVEKHPNPDFIFG